MYAVIGLEFAEKSNGVEYTKLLINKEAI